MNFPIEVISRIFHVGTAICLIGGSVFSLFALLPAAKALDADARAKLMAGITTYWKRFVTIGTLLMLVTGFYNYFQAMPKHKGDGPYHMLIGIKMLLAFAIFFLAAALVGRSTKLQFIRDARGKWLTAIVLMAAVIVAISGYLKIRGVPEIVTTAPVIAETSAL